LKQGKNIKKDKTFNLGLKAFPNLPKIRSFMNSKTINPQAFSEENVTLDITHDVQRDMDSEMKINIKKMINQFKTHVIRKRNYVSIIMFFPCFITWNHLSFNFPYYH
jgi:hypothetical protein